MTELQTEQLLYLLYAKAYSKDGTVTKGDVKGALPRSWEGNVEDIYKQLDETHLVERTDKSGKSTKRVGRFSITEEGEGILCESLARTKYRFSHPSGSKITNTLLSYIQASSSKEQANSCSEEMKFEVFKEKFKQLYFEERIQQERRGVVAIHAKSLCQKFIDQNLISKENLKHNFETLKKVGHIVSVIEKENELIQWFE